MDRNDPPLFRDGDWRADRGADADRMGCAHQAAPAACVAVVADFAAAADSRAGRVRRVDRDAETAAGDRDDAPAIGPRLARHPRLAGGAPDALARLRTRGRPLACGSACRAGAANRADRAGGMGEYQLRGARLHRLPDLQRSMDSADGLRPRLPPVARARHDRRRRDDHPGCAGGDPLDSPDLCHRGDRLSALVCTEGAPFRVAAAARQRPGDGGADPVHHRPVEHCPAMAVSHCSRP